MSNFLTFFLRNAKGNFYTLLLYKNFYIILDIIVIHMICVCIVHENCIILHFYSSSHIKVKCEEFLFFETFLFFSSKWKQKKTWFLYVTGKAKQRIHVNIVIFLNCDLLELEIRDYKKLYCDNVSFRFLRLCLRVLWVLQYSSSVINLHDVCFSNKIMVCMMYAPICSIADQLYSAPSHTSRIIARLTPHDPLKTTSKILGDFSLMKFC